MEISELQLKWILDKQYFLCSIKNCIQVVADRASNTIGQAVSSCRAYRHDRVL